MSKAKKISIAVLTLVILGVSLFYFLMNERKKARRSLDLGNLGNAVYLAVIMYASDNDDHFPPDLGVLMDQQYLDAPHIYRCLESPRARPQNGDDIRKGLCDYLYFGDDKQINDKTFPLLVVKPEVHEGYLLVVYSDGREVQYSPPPPELLRLTERPATELITK